MTLHDLMRGRALDVALSPELLSAVLRSGGQVVAHSEVRLPALHGAQPWDSALSAFGAYLRQAGVTLRGVPLTVSITRRWCRLASLPWSDALLHEASAQRYMRAYFVKQFGEAAGDCVIACDPAPPGQARTACAIERALFDGLHAIAREYGHPDITVVTKD